MKTISLALSRREILWRTIAAITTFVAVTVLAARITIFFAVHTGAHHLADAGGGAVGLGLGARGGALAQLVYLGLLAAGLPVDAKGLGPAALFGPTAGYLLGFVPAAFVTGWLAERLTRPQQGGRFVAALAGMGMIYLVGRVGWPPCWAVGSRPGCWGSSPLFW